MTKKIPLLLILILLIFLNTITADGTDIPRPPHRFMGYVINENGELAEDNTTVSALINGRYYNTTVKEGKYGYADLTEEFQVEGTDGDIIHFYINGTDTKQTAIFESGGLNINFSKNLNLTLVTTPLTITSVTVSSITKTQARISWNTNRLSNSIVRYGSTKSLGKTKRDNSFTLNHGILLNNLQPNTLYYFEVVSYDYSEFFAIDNNSGAYYSFTTLKNNEESGGNQQPGNNGDGIIPSEGEDSLPENKPPVADANGPYYGIVNKSITFDASKSNDRDGYIVEFTWDFGDGTIRKTANTTITHIYSKSDRYIVSLTVTDNDNATNSSTTYAYITMGDTDGDGWSDEAENYYGSDPNNSSSFPVDNDNDGIPDSWDSDDDNDGLTDVEEETIGTQPLNSSDVLRIINKYGLFYLIDTNNDTNFDYYYNKSSNIKSKLSQIDGSKLLIDNNDDGKYDYVYDLVSGEMSLYTKEGAQVPSYYLISIIIIVISIVLLILILWVFKLLKNKYKGGEK